MADIKVIELSNGRKVTIDLDKIRTFTRRTMKEWQAATKSGDSDAYDKQLGELSGLSVDELGDLSLVDYQKIDSGIGNLFADLLKTDPK